MKILTKHIIQCAAALTVGSMLPAFSPAVFAQGAPQGDVIGTVSNTAVAEWQSGDERLTTTSNQVDIVVRARPAPPATMELYHFTNSGPTISENIPQTMCSASNGQRPVSLVGAYAAQGTSPAQLSPATAIRAGEPLVIAVNATGQNTNSTAADSFEVTITTERGDEERLILTETAADSGRFVGIINTRAIPPAPVQRDCVLSVSPGDRLNVDLNDATDNSDIGVDGVDILVDPFGVTFDSADGRPVDGTRVTIVDNATGTPAQVFGDDGVSTFPNTVVTGTTVTDSGGQVYDFTDGFYRFPFLRPGTYRLVVEAPAPYIDPSIATPEQLAAFERPDGGPYTIVAGSYGGTIVLSDPAPVRVDIPLDRPGGVLQITKATSTTVAMPGDVVQYRIQVKNPDSSRSSGAVTISDVLPAQMRLRRDTLRYNNIPVTGTIAPDGRSFAITVAPLAGGQTGLLTYIAEIRSDAQPGSAVNLANARDNRGADSGTTDAAIRIVKDGISERFTIIGRITDGACTVDPRKANPIAGVRVMLEDGTYTVTDADGRYHFEGVMPGIHVVQVDPASFPLNMTPVDCAQNTRSAGNAISRWVEGRGGSLKRADFRAVAGAPREAKETAKAPLPNTISDVQASGADRDWVAGQEPGIGFLFPTTDHNPRVRAIRVAFKHMNAQSVELSLNGKPVDVLARDGAQKDPNGIFRVSLWRGLQIEPGENKLVARVLDANGKLVEEVTQMVRFSTSPMQAEFLRDASILVADGVTRPRIALRMTDRNGKPIQHGSVGDFEVNAPYAPAVEVDVQQAQNLAGLERAKPVWRVIGDEGIAYIELEPTTASGSLSVDLKFQDGEVRKDQRLEAWLEPGDRPWTIVGFAAGTYGFNKLEEGIETLDSNKADENLDGRIALYAKGRVTGKWLLTMAYDSDKKEDETRFGGVIDPRSYYTIYADRAEQRYDAASVRKLYLKLERPQFYALFGDYTTNIDEPELARYNRAYNGLKAEYRSPQVHVQAFGADTPYRYRRDEIQGNGLTGPYGLNSRDILPNSERITLETRDRLRSERIVERRVLTRHIDYDIDYLAGTLRFRDPILSRGNGFDPQFIIAEYEVFGVGKRVDNAGGRAKWQTADGNLQIAATAIHDETDRSRTDLAGADITYRPDQKTELRAEIATSNSEAIAGTDATNNKGKVAWVVEAEHHDEKYDILAYVRQQDGGFGVGQINAAESGTRKYGVDGRVRITDGLTWSAIAYQEEYLNIDARRRAVSSELEYRKDKTTLNAGLTHANDRLADGNSNQSTIAKLGAAQRMFNDKLEVSGQTEFALGGQDESVDFPARHRLGLRYAVNSDINLIGNYEIADGQRIDSTTVRVGFDIAPWAGGRIVASANQQDINEYGPRSYAAYGLAQSLKLDDKWSIDVTLDGNKTMSGLRTNDVLNPLQPIASGGFLGNSGSLVEDFTAITSGATYRGDRWSWTGRAEYRDGETTDRYGFNSAILRQIGEGRAVGGALSWFKADQDGGARTTSAQAEISWAHRPADSRWAFLNKTEYRYDAVTGAIAGQPGPIGGAGLNINGDAKSQRLINSFSVNFTPVDEREDDDRNIIEMVERGEYAGFVGIRYSTDRFGDDDVKGLSAVIGTDLRFDFSDSLDIGLSGTLRLSQDRSTVAYSGGPTVTITPMKNANLTLGYNFVGFEDRDFEESRYIRDGAYVTFKLKFDQESVGKLLGMDF